jgi:hypothetical protein
VIQQETEAEGSRGISPHHTESTVWATLCQLRPTTMRPGLKARKGERALQAVNGMTLRHGLQRAASLENRREKVSDPKMFNARIFSAANFQMERMGSTSAADR